MAAGDEAPPAGRRWPCGCGRARSTRSSARTTCSARARRCGGWSTRRGPAAPGRRCCSGVRRAPARRRSPTWSRRRRSARSSSCPRSPPASRTCGRSIDERPAASSARGGRETVLFVDEVHRFSKTQQDALLPGRREPLGHARRRDDGEPALLDHLAAAVAQPAAHAAAARGRTTCALLLERAVADERGLAGAVTVDGRGARPAASGSPAGDARWALTALEAAAGARTLRPAARRRRPSSDVEQRRRPGRRPLRPRRRPALRRHQRAHQEHPRQRRRRRAALPRADGRGRRGPAVHRPPAGHPRPARTSAWPTRPRCRRGGGACRRCRSSGCPRAGSTWPRPSSISPWRPSRTPSYLAIGARRRRRTGRARRPGARRTCGTRTTPGAQRLGHGKGYRYSHDDPRGVVRAAVRPGRDRRPRLLHAGRARRGARRRRPRRAAPPHPARPPPALREARRHACRHRAVRLRKSGGRAQVEVRRMETAEIRSRWLRFFEERDHVGRALRLPAPGRPQPAVRQRRHGAVQAVLPRPAGARRGRARPACRSACAPWTSRRSARPRGTARSSR